MTVEVVFALCLTMFILGAVAGWTRGYFNGWNAAAEEGNKIIDQLKGNH